MNFQLAQIEILAENREGINETLVPVSARTLTRGDVLKSVLGCSFWCSAFIALQFNWL